MTLIPTIRAVRRQLGYRSVILDEANYGGLPVSYWPLTETDGVTATDLMSVAAGSGNTGTYSPGTPWTGGSLNVLPGPIARDSGGFASFDGSSGYVNCGANIFSAHSSGTIECVLSIPTLLTSDNAWTILGLGGTNANQTTFSVEVRRRNATAGANTRLGISRVFNNSSFNGVMGSTNLVAGQSYHVAFVSNGSTWSILLNGVAETLTTWVGSNTGQWFSSISPTGPLTSIAAIKASGTLFYSPIKASQVVVSNYVLATARLQYHALAMQSGI